MKKNKRNSAAYLIFVLFIFLMFACDNTRIYEEWHDMQDNVWLEDSACHFAFELEDSLILYNMIFGIRNTNLYPYQNIWLMTSISGPDSFFYQDTIPLVLADKNGEWFGKRSASIYTYVVPLYRQLPFYKVGRYTFTIKHGMRKDALNGVSSIGFRMETSK